VRLGSGRLNLTSVGSTQDAAKALVEAGEPVSVVFAEDQTKGRGRLGRVWHSQPGESLTLSLVLWDEADHARPYLLGMAVAVAAAQAFDLRLRWPNDLLLDRKKEGGVLAELVRDPAGKLVPVVGVGLNLAQTVLPAEIAHRATSLSLAGRPPLPASEAANVLVTAVESLPPVHEWSDLRPLWTPRDDTQGLEFVLPDGRRGLATGIGDDARLLLDIGGQTVDVLAAEAWLGG
jgi:BirA family transcriptional regulator, biotin operon repressor / biotin---[acetyl-CoA-carboxylase] ligase